MELACEPRKLKCGCIAHGFIFNYQIDINVAFCEKVSERLSSITENKILLTYQLGFVGNCYLDKSGKVIGQTKGLNGPLLHSNVYFLLTNNYQQGSLEEWQQHVAKYAHYSPLTMLSIFLPFTGIICPLTTFENGGFHIVVKVTMVVLNIIS